MLLCNREFPCFFLTRTSVRWCLPCALRLVLSRGHHCNRHEVSHVHHAPTLFPSVPSLLLLLPIGGLLVPDARSIVPPYFCVSILCDHWAVHRHIQGFRVLQPTGTSTSKRVLRVSRKALGLWSRTDLLALHVCSAQEKVASFFPVVLAIPAALVQYPMPTVVQLHQLSRPELKTL